MYGFQATVKDDETVKAKPHSGSRVMLCFFDVGDCSFIHMSESKAREIVSALWMPFPAPPASLEATDGR